MQDHEKITKGTSLDFHNVAVNKTKHINNFYRGYPQDVDFVCCYMGQ